MNVVKWKPKSEVQVKSIDNVLNTFFINQWSFDKNKKRTWNPIVDIIETKSEYTLHSEIPGVSKVDINLIIKDKSLEINGEKKKPEYKENGKFHYNERYFGNFKRVFELPDSIEKDKVSASFKNGTLNIVLPKKEHSIPKSRSIKIN